MNEDKAAPSPVSSATVVKAPAVSGITRSVSASTRPLSCSARLSTRTLATVITAGWPKPEKACPDGTRPATTQASSAATATRS